MISAQANLEKLEDAEIVKDLTAENSTLKQKIQEMEAFLADYGLVWVGANQKDEIDVDLFIQKLRELRTRTDGPEVVREGRKASFKPKEAVRICIYRNGVLVKNGPFRSFASASGQTFVRDVVDGYFPTEFKSSHPDGVPFDIVDKSNELHQELSGSGRPLGRRLRTLADVNGGGSGDVYTQVSPDEFLTKLPTAVIKDGNVLDVRESIRNRLLAGNNDVLPPKTTKSPPPDPTPPKRRQEGCVVQIRNDDGSRMVLSMKVDETIGDLRAEINKFRLRRDPYEIRTAFPGRAYPDDTMTLTKAGFVPNATIFLQAFRSKEH